MFWLRILAASLLFSLAVSARAETVQSGFLMRNTPAQTRFWIKKGDLEGPTVVIIGGVHGDEPAGYLAARELANWTVESGTLVLVSDGNVPAIKAKKRFVGRNMNRLFPGKRNGDLNEQLAYELWNLTRDAQPDLVLTLHESRDFYANNPARYGQTFTYDFPELDEQFGRVAEVVNAQIGVKKHRFLLKVDAFPTCPTYCAWKWLRAPATSVETSKTLPLKTRIGYQLAACRAFFDVYGLKISPKTKS